MTRKNRRQSNLKRTLAIPFVITTGAAAWSGCASNQSAPPPPTQYPARTTPTAQRANPDTPISVDAGLQMSNGASQTRFPSAPIGGGGKTHKRPDGSCWFHYDAGACPAGAMCNPPPPKRVHCPDNIPVSENIPDTGVKEPMPNKGAKPKLPPAPVAGGKTHLRPDGSCWFHYDAPACPEGMACNPPRPKQVQCPSKLGRKK